MPVYHWAQNFTVSPDDLDFLSGVLLEREIPLQTEALAHALIERKLANENAVLHERYKNIRFYNPSESYTPDEKVVFPTLNFASATVVSQRSGNNPEYGTYNVISVQVEGETHAREFAADLTTPHKLSENTGSMNAPWQATLSFDDIMTHAGDLIVEKVADALRDSSELISVGGKWFPRSLMLDVNVGHLNLAEAVLDMMGSPMQPEEILEQIGGLGNADLSLQTFCLNAALSHDNRFDEVGPKDLILWILHRQEPLEVINTPPMLVYHTVEYDPLLLPPEMQALEVDIDDEWSELPDDDNDDENSADQVIITLIYPHRRMGTLPLNAKMRRIFPTARRTSRIYVKLVDGQDNEEYVGWVVRGSRYVYGLADLYRKHKLPVGAHVTVKRSGDPGKIIIDFQAYKPRTEWVRLITPKEGQITFEESKRAIGAYYDELMLLGTDDLEATDALFNASQRRSIGTLTKTVLSELSRSSPQTPIHAKTLYSAINVLRRLPPGPLFAAMITSPDFEYVGNNYWKLSGS